MKEPLRRVRAPAVAILAVTLAVAPVARAGGESSPEPDGLVKVESYLGCAAGLAFATTPVAAIAAFFSCVRLLLQELPLP